MFTARKFFDPGKGIPLADPPCFLAEAQSSTGRRRTRSAVKKTPAFPLGGSQIGAVGIARDSGSGIPLSACFLKAAEVGLVLFPNSLVDGSGFGRVFRSFPKNNLLAAVLEDAVKFL